MKCIKKIPTVLFIIIPILLVLVLVYFLYGASLNNYIIESKTKPIEELFAMDFSDWDEPQIADLSNCDSTRILEDREEKIVEGKIEEGGELTIGENCWRTYENDFVKFSFRDFNDTAEVMKESNKNIEISFEYNQNNILEERGFGVSVRSKINPVEISTDFCRKDQFSPATEDNIIKLKNNIDINKVMVNNRWKYYDIIEHFNNCQTEFVYFDSFINEKSTKIDRACYNNLDGELNNIIIYFIDIPNSDYYLKLSARVYQIFDVLNTIEF